MIRKLWADGSAYRVLALASLVIAIALAVPILVGAEAPGTSSRAGVAVGQAEDPCAAQTIGQFCARYYNSTDLSGTAVFSQLETTLPISHNWGSGSPAPGVVSPDGFSARWEGKILVGTNDGAYTLIAVADDGVRVWVDDTPVFDEWRAQPPASFRSADLNLQPGEHSVKMEYYENAGGAVAKLGIYKSYPGAYRAEYYNKQTFQDLPVLVQQESAIDYFWGPGSPDPVVNADHFSAIWTGTINPPAGRYTFAGASDDGIRVWLGSEQVVTDMWKVQAETAFHFTRDIGGPTPVKVEYFENEGNAVAKFGWMDACGEGSFLVDYFRNRTLAGAPALTRCETLPIHPFPAGGDPQIYGPFEDQPDNFSGRWVGDFDFAAGLHTFVASADDGVRVWLDGQLLIDQWRDQPYTTFQASRYVTAGKHTVKMEYYQHTGLAEVYLEWFEGCPPGQYKAEYFKNPTLSGNPAVMCENGHAGSRYGIGINRDWGTGGPGGTIPSDNFSVRWTGRFELAPTTYTFTARTDDGMRVWVDGDLIVDQWHVQAPTTYQATKTVTGGLHTIKVEYFEAAGGALATLNWAPAGCPTDWLKAQYYNNRTLSGTPLLVRCEPRRLRLYWGTDGPGNGIPVDNFSVRWTGTLTMPFEGEALLYTVSDDGIRVWVDGKLAIDEWHDQAPTEHSIGLATTEGGHPVKIEYYEHLGGATAEFWWEFRP